MNKIRKRLIEIIKLLLLLNVVLFITTYVVQLGFVSGKSMEPSFYNSELLVIYKFKPDINKGDVVSFTYEQAQQQYLSNVFGQQYANQNVNKLGERHIKRIEGLPGDHIKVTVVSKKGINYNQLFINNELVLEFPEQVPPQEYTLNSDQYFVLGDNRDVSFDSLYHGPITKNEIIGKVVYHTPPLKKEGNNESRNN